MVHKSAVRDGWGGRGGIGTTLEHRKEKNRVKCPVELKHPHSVPDSLSKKREKTISLYSLTNATQPTVSGHGS